MNQPNYQPIPEPQGTSPGMPASMPVYDFPVYDYHRFPRAFISYRWFKPLLVLGLGFVFMVAIQLVIALIVLGATGDMQLLLNTGSYDTMDVSTPAGALITLGSVAALLPALALALLVVQDRPFSSLSSSRGGWNWRVFWKAFGIAAVVNVVFIAIELLLSPDDLADFENTFTVGGFIVLTITCPLQCIAEEYVFRGFALQAFGSWFRFPILAIVLAAVAFAAGHPYNLLGVISIFGTGIIWGVIAWQSKGLELSSAAHIMNNLLAFYLAGFGLATISSEVDVVGTIVPLVKDVVFAVIVILVGRKRGWFVATKDGAAAFNAKKWPKYQFKAWAKQQKRTMKQMARQGAYPMPTTQVPQCPATFATEPSQILQASYVAQVPQCPEAPQHAPDAPMETTVLSDPQSKG